MLNKVCEIQYYITLELTIDPLLRPCLLSAVPKTTQLSNGTCGPRFNSKTTMQCQADPTECQKGSSSYSTKENQISP